jgi:hypothetical protein
MDIYVGPKELARAFDVAPSAVTTRSKVIRDLFKMTAMEPDWVLPGRYDENWATLKKIFGGTRRPYKNRFAKIYPLQDVSGAPKDLSEETEKTEETEKDGDGRDTKNPFEHQ